tara:strand:+ start:207 stop:950 length:744 start_codon:yes stop_codon:yes gene_type:complete
MNRTFLILVSFASLLNLQSFASSVTVQRGDTLSKIAGENNLTIKEIMDANNILDANQITEGQKLSLPIKDRKYTIHIVEKGESLNQISNLYGIQKQDLIKLNELKEPDYLMESQKLYIPKPNSISKKEIATLELSEKLDLEERDNDLNANRELISLEDKNDLIDTENSSEWRTYGPLKINWSSWKMSDKSFVANTIHETGRPLLIAIHCPKQIINRTGRDGVWRNWILPRDDFEKKLLNDVCKKKFY